MVSRSLGRVPSLRFCKSHRRLPIECVVVAATIPKFLKLGVTFELYKPAITFTTQPRGFMRIKCGAPCKISLSYRHQRLACKAGGRDSAGGTISRPSSRQIRQNAKRLSRSIAHSGRARGAPKRSEKVMPCFAIASLFRPVISFASFRKQAYMVTFEFVFVDHVLKPSRCF
jgi:hypothetical protein